MRAPAGWSETLFHGYTAEKNIKMVTGAVIHSQILDDLSSILFLKKTKAKLPSYNSGAKLQHF